MSTKSDCESSFLLGLASLLIFGVLILVDILVIVIVVHDFAILGFVALQLGELVGKVRYHGGHGPAEVVQLRDRPVADGEVA